MATETWTRQDLMDLVNVVTRKEPIPQDSDGDIFGVELFRNGETYAPGGSVTGKVTLPDGTVQTETGTLTGNRASVALPDEAYDNPGRITAAIKLTEGERVTTVGMFSAEITED